MTFLLAVYENVIGFDSTIRSDNDPTVAQTLLGPAPSC